MAPDPRTYTGRPRLRTGYSDRKGLFTPVMVGDRQYRVWLATELVEVKTSNGQWRKTTSRQIATTVLLRASDAATRRA